MHVCVLLIYLFYSFICSRGLNFDTLTFHNRGNSTTSSIYTVRTLLSKLFCYTAQINVLIGKYIRMIVVLPIK